MHDDVAVLRIAETQYGVFSRSQATKLGFSPGAVQRRVRRGSWRAVHPGVYRATGAPASWLQHCKAAVLWAGQGAAVAGLSAARLWGLDLPASVLAMSDIHVDMPTNCWRGTLRNVEVFRRRKLSSPDFSEREGVRCTTLERTLLDAAGLLGAAALEIALDSARRRHPRCTKALARLLARLGTRGRKGAGTLKKLVLDRLDLRQDSALEVRLRRRLAEAGLKPVCNVAIRDGRQHVATVDFLFRAERLVIQTHGYAFHSAKPQWNKDLAQSRALQGLGYRVIAFSADDVRKTPDACVRTVAQALLGKAWRAG